MWSLRQQTKQNVIRCTWNKDHDSAVILLSSFFFKKTRRFKWPVSLYNYIFSEWTALKNECGAASRIAKRKTDATVLTHYSPQFSNRGVCNVFLSALGAPLTRGRAAEMANSYLSFEQLQAHTGKRKLKPDREHIELGVILRGKQSI